MKQVFKYASLLFVAGALLVTSCKKKSDDDAVTPVEPVTPTCTGGSVKSLTYDVNATNPEGNAKGVKQENASVTVSKCDGSYNIVINSDNDDELDYMYILKSTDGGKKSPVRLADVKDGNGNTWTGNKDSYTLAAPGSGDKKKFTLTINIPVRDVENGTDAYEVWFTKASALGNGRFAKPDAKRDIGPILASFNYGSIKYATTTFTAEVGSQSNALPSYIVTSGTGGTFTRAEIEDDSTREFPTINMIFTILNASNTLGTTTPSFISPDQRVNVGFNTFKINGSSTTFAVYTADFAAAGETELKALAPSSAIIAIEAGKTYSFKTTNSVSGKVSVGLAKVESITGSGSDRVAKITFKVLNVNLAGAVAATEAK